MKKLVPYLLSGLVVAAPSVDAANIMFVSFHSGDDAPSAAAVSAGFTQAPDVGYTQLLQANGHTVTRVVTSDAPNAAQLNTADLVIISRSVPSGHYELDAETAAWNGITAPTIILGGYILRNNRLGYTTGTTIPDTAGSVKLRVHAPNHPIFSGVALDGSGLMVNDYATIPSFGATLQRGISVNNNSLSGGGVTLATIGTSGDPAVGGMVIAEWLAGDAMATSPVDTLGGHRLVLLTGSREHNGAPTSEMAGIYDLTSDGAQLLLNAVSYMTSGRTALRSVNTVNNENPGPNETSLLEALTDLQDGDYIRFQIPGAGPHYITTPLGGYPLITANGVTIDGYSQPGSVPNTNPILGGNNAQIKIVLDSTSGDVGPSDPRDPSLSSHRSTRMFGLGNFDDTENAILGFSEADNITVRGLSFIGRYTSAQVDDPTVYAVGLAIEATNARVQGCWFGLAPGGSTQDDIKPVSSAVAAFRYRPSPGAPYIYSSGPIVGTDGDGSGDRGEFNVIVGGRIAIALESPAAHIAGNYVNVFPNGMSFVDIDATYRKWWEAYDAAGSEAGDVTIENYENGRVTEGTVIGTNGDGISDSDERNIFGHVVYDHHGEFYSSSANAVLAGNYFGVGVDGVTPSPISTNINPDFVEFGGGGSQVRIGSNGDGVSDDLEGNLIVNVTGGRFYAGNPGTQLVSRRNRLVNCSVAGVPFAEGDNGVVYSGYYAPFLADATAGVVPVIKSLSGGILKISVPAPSAGYPEVALDVYLADPVALAKENFYPAAMVHPSTFLGTYADNGPLDTDPAPNEFAIDVSSFGITDSTYLTAAASYSSIAGNFNAVNAVTTPMASPFSAKPVLSIKVELVEGGGTTTLSWLGAPDVFKPYLNNIVNDDTGWFPIPPNSVTHTGGRNIATLAFDSFTDAVFYRLSNE